MLTLKQARRMVAKSRRRVWRLARQIRPSVTIIAGDNGLAGYYAEDWIPQRMPEAQKVCAAYVRRLHALWDLETEARGRAWRMAVYRAATQVSSIDGAPIIGLAGEFTIETIELPALDHGQDGDELLQDIADYYAESQPCRVCGAEMDWIECDHCGGEGGCDNDALMEEDPLWYDGVEWEDCTECDGKGGWWRCYQDHNNGQ